MNLFVHKLGLSWSYEEVLIPFYILCKSYTLVSTSVKLQDTKANACTMEMEMNTNEC